MPRWLLHVLLTILCWGTWGFAVRKIGDALTAEQTTVLSTLALLPIIGLLAWRLRAQPAVPDAWRRGLWLALTGGIIAGLGNLAFYRLLAAGEKASTIVPLTALYPVVTILLALVILRERCRLVQAGGIGLALAAIHLFNAGGGPVFNAWLAFALLPIALWGVAALLQKLATNHLTGEQCALGFLVGLLPVSVYLWLREPMPPGVTAENWFWVLVVGLGLGLGNLTLLAAYASGGQAAVITPLAGVYPLFTVALAVLFLGERPLPRETAAIALSLLAAVLLAWERPAAATSPTNRV